MIVALGIVRPLKVGVGLFDEEGDGEDGDSDDDDGKDKLNHRKPSTL